MNLIFPGHGTENGEEYQEVTGGIKQEETIIRVLINMQEFPSFEVAFRHGWMCYVIAEEGGPLLGHARKEMAVRETPCESRAKIDYSVLPDDRIRIFLDRNRIQVWPIRSVSLAGSVFLKNAND